MSKAAEHNTFIFSNKIDTKLLASLYEDDFAYVEEIFSITLSQLKPDLDQLKAAYANGQVEELRKWVHKVKPSFGFVGLPLIEELCRNFEKECSSASVIDSLSASYTVLIQQVEEAVITIETDYERLKNYNQS